jgi:hypothetical protein
VELGPDLIFCVLLRTQASVPESGILAGPFREQPERVNFFFSLPGQEIEMLLARVFVLRSTRRALVCF